MLGLYQPTGGAVLIDGVDLRQIDPAELRRQIGYVQQDVMLFCRFAAREHHAGRAAGRRCRRAARDRDRGPARIWSTSIRKAWRCWSASAASPFPVASARASRSHVQCCNDAPMLLLDEPTSAMDHTSEEAIKRSLAGYARGKTLLLVSHRSSSA